MNKDLKQFILKCLAVTAIITVIAVLVFLFVLPQYYHPVFPFLLAFFLFTSVGVHAYQLWMLKKDIGRFTRSNMVITFLKLVLYSLFAVVFIATNPSGAVGFVVCMMLLYIVFSFLEITEITRIVRRKQQ